MKAKMSFMTKTEKITCPFRCYNVPEEIKTDPTLSAEEQIILLENWLDDIIKKQIAEEESMIAVGPVTPDFTARVQNLLRHIKNS